MQKLSEIFAVPISNIENKEPDREYQKQKLGDYIIHATVEWKTNSYENWKSFDRGGKVLFETYSNVSMSPIRGSNLFTCMADLWAHAFSNKEENGFIEVLVFNVKRLRDHLLPRESTYYSGATSNREGYLTGWILVPFKEIEQFIVKHIQN